jgi:hypothetical protein
MVFPHHVAKQGRDLRKAAFPSFDDARVEPQSRPSFLSWALAL